MGIGVVEFIGLFNGKIIGIKDKNFFDLFLGFGSDVGCKFIIGNINGD